MKRISWWLLFSLLFLAASLAFVITIDSSLTLGVSEALGIASLNLLDNDVFEFISLMDNYPERYLIVIGSYAKEHEIEHALKISERFGITVKKEEDVSKRENLILIGTPGTNLLLDKFLVKPYSKEKSVLFVSSKNLIAVFSDKHQGEEITNMIINYRDERHKLAPETAKIEIRKSIIYAIFLLVGIIPLIFSFYENKRKALDMQNKKEVVRKYIDENLQSGYSEEEVRKWLAHDNIDENIVKECLEEIKNA